MAFALCCIVLGALLGKDEPLWGSFPTGDGDVGEGFPTCLTSPTAEHPLVSLANTLQLVVPLRRASSDGSG